jgi:hypothetical protein
VSLLYVLAFIFALYVVPAFVARRIAKRKGRMWFPYWFFGGWPGVIVLKLRSPRYDRLRAPAGTRYRR